MSNEIIAYAGNVKLVKSIWDNDYGMWVTLELEQRAHERTTANPFKKFTKMKKDRVGTRFSAVFLREDQSEVYRDDVMLKGWTDGTTGWKVSLWVTDNEDQLHPFMNFDNGAEFSMAVVELDDDEEPINQVKRDRVSRPRKQGLSNYAAQLCRSEKFRDYLTETYTSTDWLQYGQTWTAIIPEWMYITLGIRSRAELDTDPAAAANFHEMIRKPYVEWFDIHG